ESPDFLPIYQLILNLMEQDKYVYYVLNHKVWICPLWIGVTSPNAQLISSVSKWALESGIYGFWIKLETSLTSDYDDFISSQKYNNNNNNNNKFPFFPSNLLRHPELMELFT